MAVSGIHTFSLRSHNYCLTLDDKRTNLPRPGIIIIVNFNIIFVIIFIINIIIIAFIL